MQDSCPDRSGAFADNAPAGGRFAPPIPNHNLILRIGQGAYGEVWLARHVLGVFRAVKIVRRAAFDSELLYEREFEGVRKYEATSKIHSGLIQIFEVGRDPSGGFYYYVMELADRADPAPQPSPSDARSGCPGSKMEAADGKASETELNANYELYVPSTLRNKLTVRKRFAVDECVELGLRIADALEHLHFSGLVHRDVKPSNVVYIGGQPKLADIGLVTHAGEHRTVAGTEGYMPPEGTGMPRGDLYCLGKVLYELATGKDCHRYPEPITEMGQLLERERIGELMEVLIRLCHRDPDRRYPNVAALRRDLLLLRAGESVVGRHRVEFWAKILIRGTAAVCVATVVAMAVMYRTFRERERRLEAEIRMEQLRVRAVESEARLGREVNELSRRLAAERVEQAFSDDRAAEAIGHLVQFLRTDPSDSIAIQRLMSALSHRTFGLSIGQPWLHGGEVYVARFDSTGKRVVTACRDGLARIWDTRAGKTLGQPMAHEGPVRYVEFDPKCERVLTASDDGIARIWSAETGEALTPPLRHGAAVVMATFSPDGKWVISASADKTARIWDANTGHELGEPLGHDGKVNVGRFSPNGQLVVTATESGMVVIRDWNEVGTSNVRFAWKSKFEIMDARFSPDGKRLVAAGSESHAKLWDTTSWEPIGTPMEHEASIRTAVFSPDGRRLVTASWDRTARVWNSLDGSAISRPMRHSHQLRSAVFSSDGLKVATASADNTLRVWDAFSGEPLTEPMHHAHKVRWVEFSQDGLSLVSASQDGTVRLWDLQGGGESPELIPVLTSGHSEYEHVSGKLVVAGMPAVVLDGVYPSRFQDAVGMHSDADTELVKLSADGTRVAGSLTNGEVHLWDARTGQPAAKRLIHARHVTAIEFSPDSQSLATASFDHTARIWNVATGEALTPPLEHGHEVWNVGFSPNGLRLVTASLDGAARLWDARNGLLLGEPLKHDGQVLDARFNPSGDRVVTTSNDRTARLWDATTGSPLAPALRHLHTVKSARFSQDGRKLVTVTEGGTAWIWNLEWITRPPRILHHDGEIHGAEFSPDGKTVLTASEDGMVRIWESTDGRPISDPFSCEAPVLSAHFSPDGGRVVASTLHGNPRVWTVPEFPAPIPEWVCNLAQALTGGIVGEVDSASSSGQFAVKQTEQSLRQLDPLDPYVRWGRWFLHREANRTISAFSEIRINEYQDAQLQRRNIFAAHRVLLRRPSQLRALAVIPRNRTPAGIETFFNTPTKHGQQRAQLMQEALDHLILNRVDTDPDTRVRAWTLVQHLSEGGASAASLAYIDRLLGRDARWINGWIAKGWLLESMSSRSAALDCYRQALDLATRSPEAPHELRRRMLFSRARLLGRLAPEDVQADFRTEWNIPRRDPSTAATAIDLSAYFNSGFSDSPYSTPPHFDNDLMGVLEGRQKIHGIEFDVRGYLQVVGGARRKRDTQPLDRKYPSRIEGILLGGRYRSLHFLHAFYFEALNQDSPSSYVIHYSNGSPLEVPIVYGQDAACWMGIHGAMPRLPRATPVRMGQNVSGYPIYFFLKTWENPFPDQAIQSLDLVAGEGWGGPFLVALSVQ